MQKQHFLEFFLQNAIWKLFLKVKKSSTTMKASFTIRAEHIFIQGIFETRININTQNIWK